MPHLKVQRQGGTREQVHKNMFGSSLFIAPRGCCPRTCDSVAHTHTDIQNMRICSTHTHKQNMRLCSTHTYTQMVTA